MHAACHGQHLLRSRRIPDREKCRNRPGAADFHLSRRSGHAGRSRSAPGGNIFPDREIRSSRGRQTRLRWRTRDCAFRDGMSFAFPRCRCSGALSPRECRQWVASFPGWPCCLPVHLLQVAQDLRAPQQTSSKSPRPMPVGCRRRRPTTASRSPVAWLGTPSTIWPGARATSPRRTHSAIHGCGAISRSATRTATARSADGSTTIAGGIRGRSGCSRHPELRRGIDAVANAAFRRASNRHGRMRSRKGMPECRSSRTLARRADAERATSPPPREPLVTQHKRNKFKLKQHQPPMNLG